MNAKELLLKEVMNKRRWYAPLGYNTTQASQLKLYAKQGRLSYERACDILQKLGYTKIKEEEWLPPKLP